LLATDSAAKIGSRSSVIAALAVSDRGIAWLAGLALSRLSTNGSESFANADRLGGSRRLSGDSLSP
jgi:hypothetical protein